MQKSEQFIIIFIYKTKILLQKRINKKLISCNLIKAIIKSLKLKIFNFWNSYFKKKYLKTSFYHIVFLEIN